MEQAPDEHSPTLFLTPYVKKINKRLRVVIWETDEVYYTPPDFIRDKMKSRLPMIDLCDELEYTPFKDWFDVIMKFETKLNTKR